MGGHDRWRRIGRALIVAGVLYIALMITSGVWWFGYGGESFVADIGDGTLYLAGPQQFQLVSSPLVGFTGGRNGTWTWWRWGVDGSQDPYGPAYTIWPLGFVMIAAGLACAVPGWKRARRRARGLCEKCAYSRAGLAEGAACPECGHAGE